MADVVKLVRRTVEADFDGHERVWVSAPDTCADVPTRELVEEFYPDAKVRGDLDGHAALVDTSKAERLFGWQPERSWRDLR